MSWIVLLSLSHALAAPLTVDGASAEARIALSSVRAAAAELPESDERTELFARLDTLELRLGALERTALGTSSQPVMALVPRNGALVGVPVDTRSTDVRGRGPRQHTALGTIDVGTRPIADVLQQVEAESFADGRLRIIRTAAQSRWFTAAQVRQILLALDFSEERIEAGRILYPRVVDIENWSVVYGAFDFKGDAQRLEETLPPRAK